MAVNLHEGQSEVFEDLFVDQAARYAAVNCSRGWGKSYLASTAAVTAVTELLELPKNVPNKMVYIVAPTYDQVVDIYYPMIAYDLGVEDYCVKSSRDLGRFVFENNVELRLLSYEAVERMRGKGAYFVVWDEVSSCKKGIDAKDAWESVIQPCIVTRWSKQRAKMYGARSAGRALIISTPKGYNYFHTLCHNHETNPDWKYYHYDYTASPFLDPKEIEAARQNMDPIKFASEYLADFKESGISVFYMFDRKTHVRSDLPYFTPPTSYDKKDGEEVHVMIDFNVGLQCTSAWAVRGGQPQCLRQFKGHPDTETLAKVLQETFKGHKITAYPDPSGRARKTSATVGTTDFNILEAHGIRCLAREKAPPMVDSVNAVNRMFKNANGHVNAYVSNQCPDVILSLERTKWVEKADSALIDKSEGIEHFSDGIRYGFEYMFPVHNVGDRVHRAARGRF